MNRLAGETSPYLRQHADNPVDWYPWGDEAFARARAEDKPILLSVGYSSCHWCHVMAHESFEDPDVAAVMNRLFVNVKVDREERPDVDAIYMQAVQAMTGRGGWPMTVFLAPDGRPFFGGTYFPKEDRHGHARVRHACSRRSTRRGAAGGTTCSSRRGSSRRSSSGPAAWARPATGRRPSPDDPRRARTTRCATQFDPQFGGFGRAPKFPQAMTLDFLLRAVRPQRGSPRRSTWSRVSLDAMAAGGMYDQVGGGFHRYSVDDHWLVPHFEKMLYDQALLAGAYLHGVPRDRRAALPRASSRRRSATCCATCATPTGGFFSAEDADSEGVEGKFYLWSLDEIERSRAATTRPRSIRYFGVTEGGNFEDPHTGYRGNILHVVDRDRGPARGGAAARCRSCSQRAQQRVRPGLDDKVLLAWNALFLRSLAEAAAAFERDDWMDAARANAPVPADGAAARRRPAAALVAGRPRPPSSPTPRTTPRCSRRSCTLAEVDDVGVARRTPGGSPTSCCGSSTTTSGGGFFTTGADAEALIVRPKDVQDNATPSENSLAANGLLRLAALTGEGRLRGARAGGAPAARPGAGRAPTAFAYLLGALERAVTPPLEVAIVGDAPNGADALRREVVAPAAAGVGDGRAPRPVPAPIVTPLLADRDTGRRQGHRVRVRALRVPAAGHDAGGPARAARRRAGVAPR